MKDRIAISLGPQEIRRRYFYVFEINVYQGATLIANLMPGLGGSVPRAVLVHDKAGRFAGLIVFSEDNDWTVKIGGRDETLGAVDHIIITVLDCGGGNLLGVRTGSRFCEGKRSKFLTCTAVR